MLSGKAQNRQPQGRVGPLPTAVSVILSASGRKARPTKQFRLTELARGRAGPEPSTTWPCLPPRSLPGGPSVWEVQTDGSAHPAGGETLVSEGTWASKSSSVPSATPAG